MPSAEQRRSVVRALTEAYYQYRDLSCLQVCKAKKIFVHNDPDDEFGGECGKVPHPEPVLNLALVRLYEERGWRRKARQEEKKARKRHAFQKRYRWEILIPSRKAPPKYRQHVFWHEFAHIFVEKELPYRRLEGYPGYLQRFERSGEYWIHERLCEGFADLMLLYRSGVAETPLSGVEAFLFEDEDSIGYGEVINFSVRRIAKYCDEAEAAKRNIDLSSLKAFLWQQERSAYSAPHQPLLPTNFRDCHQVAGEMFYVDEREDLLTNEQHWDKASWKRRHPEELRLLREMEALKILDAQEALFEEAAEADRRKFNRRFRRLDRAVAKFQQS